MFFRLLMCLALPLAAHSLTNSPRYYRNDSQGYDLSLSASSILPSELLSDSDISIDIFRRLQPNDAEPDSSNESSGFLVDIALANHVANDFFVYIVTRNGEEVCAIDFQALEASPEESLDSDGVSACLVDESLLQFGDNPLTVSVYSTATKRLVLQTIAHVFDSHARDTEEDAGSSSVTRAKTSLVTHFVREKKTFSLIAGLLLSAWWIHNRANQSLLSLSVFSSSSPGDDHPDGSGGLPSVLSDGRVNYYPSNWSPSSLFTSRSLPHSMTALSFKNDSNASLGATVQTDTTVPKAHAASTAVAVTPTGASLAVTAVQHSHNELLTMRDSHTQTELGHQTESLRQHSSAHRQFGSNRMSLSFFRRCSRRAKQITLGIARTPTALVDFARRKPKTALLLSLSASALMASLAQPVLVSNLVHGVFVLLQPSHIAQDESAASNRHSSDDRTEDLSDNHDYDDGEDDDVEETLQLEIPESQQLGRYSVPSKSTPKWFAKSTPLPSPLIGTESTDMLTPTEVKRILTSGDALRANHSGGLCRFLKRCWTKKINPGPSTGSVEAILLGKR